MKTIKEHKPEKNYKMARRNVIGTVGKNNIWLETPGENVVKEQVQSQHP